MVDGVSVSRLKDRDVYLLRAEQARAEADEATLENVRERCLRAEAAWSIRDRCSFSALRRS